MIYDSTYKDTVTRKTYSARRGVSTPFTCLKNYKIDTPARTDSLALCSDISAHTDRTAANIVYDVSNACGISPKVMIVLLQKEQGLVTDDWPWPVQYKKATGYGCPDTAPCDSQYFGFFNQVYKAAWQFKKYAKTPDNYNYQKGFKSFVQYHPSTSCGGTNITITNQATADLYNYTPYQPNQAALDHLYGTGNSCSSYGNRNFWRYYTDWFGSTHPKCTSDDRTGVDVYRLFNIKNGRRFLTAMECEANTLDAYTSYRLEGPAFQQAPTSSDGRTGVYRLVKKNKRFWTASVKERDDLVDHGFTLEGTAFIVLSNSSTTPKKPVYRLYNFKNGSHLWTPSQHEKDTVSAYKDWRYEGIAYYINQ
jgi:hypothetical protein